MYYTISDRENWTEKKKASRLVARRLHILSSNLMLHSGGKLTKDKDKAERLERRAVRMGSCAGKLHFKSCPECNIRYMVGGAHLCKDRLCPICSWRRAKALSRRLRDIVSNNSGRYILLTLTVKNCNWSRLKTTVKNMLCAWGKMSRRARFKRAFSGWVRTLEITRGKDGLAHPHLHVLLQTTDEYFSKGSSLWVPQDEWATLWARALGVEYRPVVDVRAVKDIGGAIKEVTKYIAKDAQVSGLSDDDFLAYAEAVAGVRTWAAGGTMRRADADVTEKELLEGEGSAPTECPICGRELVDTLEEWDVIERSYNPVIPPPRGGIIIYNYGGVVNLAPSCAGNTGAPVQIRDVPGGCPRV